MFLCSGCIGYRYFPSPQQHYGLDSAGAWRVNLDAYPYGGGIAIAASPINHWALTAHGLKYRTNSSYIFDVSEYSESDAWSVGGGIGYYVKFTQKKGFDVFATYEHQRVQTTAFEAFDVYPAWDISANGYLDRRWHTVRIQPSFYHKSTVDFYTALGVSFVGVLDAEHYYESANRIGDLKYDILWQPGVAMRFKKIGLELGVTPCFSSTHAVLSQEFRMLRASVKLSIVGDRLFNVLNSM